MKEWRHRVPPCVANYCHGDDDSTCKCILCFALLHFWQFQPLWRWLESRGIVPSAHFATLWLISLTCSLGESSLRRATPLRFRPTKEPVHSDLWNALYVPNRKNICVRDSDQMSTSCLTDSWVVRLHIQCPSSSQSVDCSFVCFSTLGWFKHVRYDGRCNFESQVFSTFVVMYSSRHRLRLKKIDLINGPWLWRSYPRSYFIKYLNIIRTGIGSWKPSHKDKVIMASSPPQCTILYVFYAARWRYPLNPALRSRW